MENYIRLKNRHHKEISKLPIKWAFDNKQFNQILEHWNLTKNNFNKLIRIPGGGFMLKKEEHLLDETLKRHKDEINNAIKNDNTGENFIFDMFNYELANHEYCVTGDCEPALYALDLSLEDIDNNKSLQIGLRKAIKNQGNMF